MSGIILPICPIIYIGSAARSGYQKPSPNPRQRTSSVPACSMVLSSTSPLPVPAPQAVGYFALYERKWSLPATVGDRYANRSSGDGRATIRYTRSGRRFQQISAASPNNKMLDMVPSKQFTPSESTQTRNAFVGLFMVAESQCL